MDTASDSVIEQKPVLLSPTWLAEASPTQSFADSMMPYLGVPTRSLAGITTRHVTIAGSLYLSLVHDGVVKSRLEDLLRMT